MGPETVGKGFGIVERMIPSEVAAAGRFFDEVVTAAVENSSLLKGAKNLLQPTEAAMRRFRGTAGDLEVVQNKLLHYSMHEPETGFAFRERGMALKAFGHHEEAVGDFSRSLELEPDNWASLVGRGGSLRKLGLHEESLGDLNKAIEVGKQSTQFREMPQVYVERGRTYHAMQLSDEGDDDFLRAKELNPLLDYPTMLIE
jgi:tetratricopeptide (TPR) repeat protein